MSARDRVFVALLGLGVVVGLGLEIARFRRGAHHRREAFFSRVAGACAEGAHRPPPR